MIGFIYERYTIGIEGNFVIAVFGTGIRGIGRDPRLEAGKRWTHD
jgi:hypothetical protein